VYCFVLRIYRAPHLLFLSQCAHHKTQKQNTQYSKHHIRSTYTNFCTKHKQLIKISNIQTTNCSINSRLNSSKEHHFAFLEFSSLNWQPKDRHTIKRNHQNTKILKDRDPKTDTHRTVIPIKPISPKDQHSQKTDTQKSHIPKSHDPKTHIPKRPTSQNIRYSSIWGILRHMFRIWFFLTLWHRFPWDNIADCEKLWN
jgi:hypothetical protein